MIPSDIICQHLSTKSQVRQRLRYIPLSYSHLSLETFSVLSETALVLNDKETWWLSGIHRCSHSVSFKNVIAPVRIKELMSLDLTYSIEASTTYADWQHHSVCHTLG